MVVTGEPMPGSRIFAALYDIFAGGAEKRLATRRAQLAGGARGRVLEIGAGTGANAPYYRSRQAGLLPHPDPLPLGEGVSGPSPSIGEGEGVLALTLTDRSPHMLSRLREKLKGQGQLSLPLPLRERAGVRGDNTGSITVVEVAAESLPFPDASFDTVVASLMLCSVGSQAQALSEVRRVLRPGGELRFMEHVRSSGRCWAVFQSAIKPFWRIVGDGCEPDRSTVVSIRAAGFEVVEMRSYNFGPYPVRPHVIGVARKPS